MGRLLIDRFGFWKSLDLFNAYSSFRGSKVRSVRMAKEAKKSKGKAKKSNSKKGKDKKINRSSSEVVTKKEENDHELPKCSKATKK